MKGYGFIVGNDGKEYFVHFSALGEGVFLKENDAVSFDPVESERGWQAQNVKILEGGSEAPAQEASEEPMDESSDDSGDDSEESMDESSDGSGDDSDDESEEKPASE